MRRVHTPRRPSGRIARSRRGLPGLELLEARQLLASGPLTVTITELGTSPLESVTIVDNGTTTGPGVGADADGTVGTISYNSLGGPSPFTDFVVNGFQAFSNRTAGSPVAVVTQSGTITRTNANAGTFTLQVVVTDTGFLTPTDPSVLNSQSNVTFGNSTTADQAQYTSTAAGVSSRTLTLTPTSYGAGSVTTESLAAPPAPLPDVSPFNVTTTYLLTLGASSSSNDTVKFNDTSLTTVPGANNPAQLSGTVFSDANHNLTNPTLPGDSGLPGITVTLAGNDVAGNPVLLTTSTDQNGNYTFSNLAQSDASGYTITEGATPGYLHEGQVPGRTGGTTGSRTITTVLPKSGNSTGNNFGEELPAQLSGVVYLDSNHNLAQDSGEPGIAGATLTLTGTDDAGIPVSLTTTTDSTGAYSFPGLRPTTTGYTVTETQPAAYGHEGQVAGSTGGTTGPHTITTSLGGGANSTGNDFAEVPASFGGTVYYDANRDGMYDAGDSPLSGVTLTLTGTDVNNNPVSASVKTAPDGSYSFTGLAAGTYQLVETQPTGYGQGTDSTGNAGGLLPVQISNLSDTDAGILLTGGLNATGYNFGETLGSISGLVYNDLNGNGLLNAGESGITGGSVTLTGSNALSAITPITIPVGAGGTYSFGGLLSGTYTVTETTLPAGYTASGSDVGTVGGSPDGTSAGATVLSSIGLGGGQSAINEDFGVDKAITIIGYKFNDLNGDGVWEANGVDPVRDAYGNPITTTPEAGLGGVTIALYTDTNGSLSKSPLQRTVTSSAAGSVGYFSFANLATLPAGTSYAVREVVPPGWVQTTANPADVPATSGGSATNVDFGDILANCACTYTINSETVTSPNGPTRVSRLAGNTQQGDMVSVTFTVAAGKTADLSLVSYTAPGSSFDANTASQQVVFDSASTGPVGPGTYTLTVQIPNGDYQVDLVCGAVIDKFGPSGSNDFYHAQGRFIDGDNGGTEAQLTNPASIAGAVYVDTNDDGQLDGSEVGLAGVTVNLTGTDAMGNSVSLTRITGSNGAYRFLGLRPGTYTVSEVHPSGYFTTQNAIGTVDGSADGHLATPSTDVIDHVILQFGNNGLNYDFGEIPVGCSIAHGTTATIGFWHNGNGQALIDTFNGGSTSTALANWLATSFPNLYGAKAGAANNLTGKTNAQVAAYYTDSNK